MQHFVHVGQKRIAVELADTEPLRAQGLSGRAALDEGTGMLFVLEIDDYWAVWMKDMGFSIDIVWLDAEGRVLSVVEGAAPESYPKIFLPKAAAHYVLELPAGAAARYGLAEGAKVVVE